LEVKFKSFTYYITQAQSQQFLKVLISENSFYSFLMDGSMDVGNIVQELVVVLTSFKDDAAKEIQFF